MHEDDDSALVYCQSELQRHDHERYLTTLFAPAGLRPALLALYAFNLEIARTAEAVSEPTLGMIRLQWWRDAVDEIYNGTPRRHQVVDLMAETLPAGGLTARTLFALIDARERDLDPSPFADAAALTDYIGTTAGALQGAALELLAPRADDATRAATQATAIAYGLAGLLRAVPFHARRSRLYLPQSLLRTAGLRADRIRPERAAPELSSVVQPLVGRAEAELADARKEMPKPGPALPALLPGTIAGHHLRRLRRCGFDPYALPPDGGRLALTVKLCAYAWRGRF